MIKAVDHHVGRRAGVWMARGGVSIFGLGLVIHAQWLEYAGLSVVAIPLLVQITRKSHTALRRRILDSLTLLFAHAKP